MPADVVSSRRPRVAVTRELAVGDPLRRALTDHGFEPVSCAVMEEGPPPDVRALERAARTIEQYDWVVCASRRAVVGLVRARGRPWPAGVRTAAVGARTAAALVDAGADPPPVVASHEGAEALWSALGPLDHWPGRRVLVPTVAGGLRILAVRLRQAGARVDEVDAYSMRPRGLTEILADWRAAGPSAVVVTSPAAGRRLTEALGVEALNALGAVVAIGPTTSRALADLAVFHTAARRATPDELAQHLASVARG